MNAYHTLFISLQEAQQGDTQQGFNVTMSVPNVTMAKSGGGGGGNMGSGSSLSMVMERSKLEFVMPTPPQQAPKLDDGGSGGDDGKHNHNGGGGGDGGDGDDDDYFGEGDGEGDGQGGSGGGGDGFFRTALPELYDRLTIAAVLQEWYKTVVELPLFIRRAVEMGLFSSAQLVRFLSMDVRPNMARSVSRTLPAEVSQCWGWGGCIGLADVEDSLESAGEGLLEAQDACMLVGVGEREDLGKCGCMCMHEYQHGTVPRWSCCSPYASRV